MPRLFETPLSWLREAFTENLGLKLLSLTFALGLFAFLHSQEEQQQRTLPVGVVLLPPPENSERELMTPIPASIHATVRGPARSIDKLIQNGVPPVTIDLRDDLKESISFEPRLFSLPDDVEITIIDPPRIDLEWQDVRRAADPDPGVDHRKAGRRLRGQG